MIDIDNKTKSLIFQFQKNEITERFIYDRLSRLEKDPRNAEVLKSISGDENRHYGIWKSISGEEVRPNRLKIWWYILLARVFGVTFAVKLMEAGEQGAQDAYNHIAGVVPEAEKIGEEENGHEKELVAMINEERVKYISSIVLGLNDALVELTGTLAGLTFALQNARVVGVAGLITGIAAALSMAASEYLSIKAEPAGKDPIKASLYTGVTYVLAVNVLIIPFIMLGNPYVSLLFSLLGAIILIAIFAFYFSVIRGCSFKQRLAEMLGVSLGVAFLSFLIGLLVRQFLGVNL